MGRRHDVPPATEALLEEVDEKLEEARGLLAELRQTLAAEAGSPDDRT